MMNLTYLKSSIGKKQVVATTGLLLVLFVIGHLAGNLFFYGGPNAFNAYAEKLAHLRPGLYVVEFGLLWIFLVHIYFTALIVTENIRTRGQNYAVSKAVGARSLATRIMPYTGTYILIFVVWHLLDFTFIDKTGPRSMMPNGIDFGLYGVVYNSFVSPWHSFGYIAAMGCLGFHLAHGIQSFFQTFGFNQPRHTPMIQNVSNFLGIAIAFGYSTIPILVMLHHARYFGAI